MLVVVILELAFAFGVGVSCVVFSANLVKALSANNPNDRFEENGQEYTDQDLSGASFSGQHSRFNYRTFSSDDEFDIETRFGEEMWEQDDEVEIVEVGKLHAAVSDFTEYIRFW